MATVVRGAGKNMSGQASSGTWGANSGFQAGPQNDSLVQ